ncbi:ATP-binding cassette domain-containing protein [Anaerobium acetethylicum]|uniref:ABC-type sugar transport system, ATPase component n=1 Tax=Anaerobium acetethylicum TaxID=1619234 RepID=A0A1D3TWA8_9FIRM|nr:ATP-binding cassette domain-containing protein [Anaerobium acetethylicum]SCP98494.1 ABC-type sugar transport system, ATPase component [Anaerobium acetethylicum]
MKKEILRMETVYIGDAEPYLLNNFCLSMYEGEIVNLIGLSGSGKTLLLHYFYGNVPIDKGRVVWNEKEFGPGKCFVPEQKLICIGQESSLVSKMTVAENICILSRKKKGSFFIKGNISYRAKLLLSQYAPDIRPDMLVEELTPFQQHVVSLLRAIENEAALVVIDDIFQSYGYQEVLKIKTLLTELKNLKISILYESHRSDFMLNLSDRIVVMRKGMNVRTFYQEDYNEELCKQLLVGNELPKAYTRKSHMQKEEILRLSDFSCGETMRDVDLHINKGEVVGLYDQENYGNKELVLSLIGECAINKGMIQYQGKPYVPKNLDFAIQNNIGYLPRNRNGVSLVESMSFMDNLFLPVMKKTSRFHFINEYAVLNFLSNEYMEELGITEKDKNRNVRCFDSYIHNSILLTRWLLFRPSLMICVEPCANADILMQNIIYDSLEKMSEQGSGVLISASDLNELKPICDRIFTIQQGKLMLLD